MGAVLVCKGEIIERAHNLVESSFDPTAHAELLSVRKAATCLNQWRLLDATLYCTLEPCPMCAGAMIHSRIERLVWGAPDLRCGADGAGSIYSRSKHPIHQVSVTRGILAEESAALERIF